MVPILAWRNVWRNKTRSMVVIIAIALGIWAALFMSGFASGMVESYINNAINNVVSHIQIHHPEFKEEQNIQHSIPNSADIQKRIAQEEGVKGVSIRTLVNGMVSSSAGGRGAQIVGVAPKDEAQTRGINTHLIKGTYFQSDRKNQLVLSKRLADKLQVKLRSKVVLTFHNMDTVTTAAAFRVVGIFDTDNNPFDEGKVFVLRKDLTRLLTKDTRTGNTPELAHEIAVLLDGTNQIEERVQRIQEANPNLLVESYRTIAPDLRLYEGQMANVSLIYFSIILLALVFGIINTMLMAVLERMRELGMLMAIGMNKVKVFILIVLETFMLSLVGVPVGILLGFLTIQYFGNYGLDLSTYSESMQEYGISAIVYFDLDPIVYVQAPILVSITALIASIYPAWKAINLKPVEAIRKI